ncbi:MAG: 50S ribosomal protein L23 [bacterium]|nr:50S ribosomal protein L23 [bacterium]
MSIVQTLKKKIVRKETGKEEAPSSASATPGHMNEADRIGESVQEKKGQATAVLRKPRVTEKTAELGIERIYTFDVDPKASKHEVRLAVEKMYGVNAVSVRTITVHRKKRTRGKLEGWKKGYKKALVKIKEGQTIEISS